MQWYEILILLTENVQFELQFTIAEHQTKF